MTPPASCGGRCVILLAAGRGVVGLVLCVVGRVVVYLVAYH